MTDEENRRGHRHDLRSDDVCGDTLASQVGMTARRPSGLLRLLREMGLVWGLQDKGSGHVKGKRDEEDRAIAVCDHCRFTWESPSICVCLLVSIRLDSIVLKAFFFFILKIHSFNYIYCYI